MLNLKPSTCFCNTCDLVPLFVLGIVCNNVRRSGVLCLNVNVIDKNPEYQDPMLNIFYPDYDRLSFWGVPYQFDYVFGPGTEQAKVRPRKHIMQCAVLTVSLIIAHHHVDCLRVFPGECKLTLWVAKVVTRPRSLFVTYAGMHTWARACVLRCESGWCLRNATLVTCSYFRAIYP